MFEFNILMSDRKKKHVFTKEEREQWIKWKQQQQGKKRKHANLSDTLDNLPNAPTLRTIEMWENYVEEGQTLETDTSHWGQPSLLTPAEKEVLAGWVLKQEAHERVTSADKIIQFVKGAFDVDVSQQWASKTVHSLGFTSQRTKTSAQKQPMSAKIDTLTHVIETVRGKIRDGLELSDMVAADETLFWNSGATVRSYAVRGG